MKEKRKINIGLDIGIASIGWAITENKYEENEIKTINLIDSGVRLFPSVDELNKNKMQLKNWKRREKRTTRRLLRRKKTLKRDFVKYLIEEKIIDDIKLDEKNNFVRHFNEKYIIPSNDASHIVPYQIRKKGLSKSLSVKENLIIMYWYLGMRGFKYDLVEINESKKPKEEKRLKRELGDEKFDFQNDLPINIQIKFFESKGHYRGLINSKFHIKSWIKEIESIFKNQKLIPQKLKIKFLDLFKRKRNFSKGPGPGNWKTPSKNSIFSFKKDKTFFKKYKNIWEKNIASCSIYKNEKRASKNSLSSEIFNLLNDLNNLWWGSFENKFKLNKHQKIHLLKLAFLDDGNENKFNVQEVQKYISKEFNIKRKEINGFRTSKAKLKQSKEITEINSLKTFNTLVTKKIKWEDFFDPEKNELKLKNNIIDKWVLECFKSKVIKERKQSLSFLRKYDYSQKEIIDLATKSPSFDKTHSFSLKALQEFIPLMLNSSKNQSQIINTNLKINNEEKVFSKSKYIPKNWVNNIIISPVSKRSIIQTIKIINSILKKYIYKNQEESFQIDNIVIEMARELNSEEVKIKKDAIIKYNKDRKDKLKKQIEYIKKTNSFKDHPQLLKKIELLDEQNYMDVFDGKPLEIEKVISGEIQTEIEHIIPYSLCFDSSNSNLVLTTLENNRLKKKRQPFFWLSKTNFEKMEKLWEVWFKSKPKKLKNLKSKIDYRDSQNQLFFIQRNINDTRYITKEVRNVLEKFFKEKNLKTKIKTVNGRMINFFRKYMGKLTSPEIPFELIDKVEKEKFDDEKQEKIRTWNGHHAQDAIIIVSSILFNLKLIKSIEKSISSYFGETNLERDQKIKKNIAFLNTFDPKSSLIFNKIKNILNQNVNNIKFSYMVRKPNNIQLFDETLYRGIKIKDAKNNEKYLKIYKTNENLVDLPKKECEVLFDDSKTNLRCFKYDKKLYYELKEIWLNHKDKPYPFDSHLEQIKHSNYITLKDGRKIKKLRKTGTLKKIENIIIPKKDNCAIGKRKRQSFYENNNWIKILLFKNSKNFNKIIPINALNYDFQNQRIKKEKYYQQLKKFHIQKNSIPIEIFRGTNLINNSSKVLYRVVGQKWEQNSLEITPINFIRKKGDKNRITISINKIPEDYKIVYVDFLGKF